MAVTIAITPASGPDLKRPPWPAEIALSRPQSAARCAGLLAACMLLGQCSAVPMDSVAAPALPSDYGALAAKAVNGFKPFATYGNFEISPPRWVHGETGWNWLVCLRYQDRGRPRYYAIFFQGENVTNSRYDVLTDRCGAQPYMPFDLATGKIDAAPR